MENKLKGITLAIVLGIIAKFIAPYLGKIGSVTTAIVLGATIANLYTLPKSFAPGIKFSEKHLLGLAIILMGFRLELSAITELGAANVLLIAIVMCATILLSIVIGRALGLSETLSAYVGVGTAVCGSSAIAAATPIVKGKESESGLAIASVNFLGAVGIFIVPLIAIALSLSETATQFLVGGSLQAVGHVAAAGYSISESIGDSALIVKMTRIVLLAPLLIVLSRMFHTNSKVSFKLPYFIVGFFVCIGLASIGILPAQIVAFFVSLSKQLLIVAMAAIGLKIKLKEIVSVAPKALGLAIGVMILQMVLLLVLL